MDLGDIQSGEYKDVVFSMYTNNRATSIDISLNLIEQRPKYSSNQKLNLAFNRVEKSTEELVVQGIETKGKEINLSTLTIDIEKDIPELAKNNKNAVAVIIGNQRYLNTSVPSVDYAIFYEPVPSEIRNIQRRGRVARQTTGKVIFLITKGTRDEVYYYAALRKEKKMKGILYDLKNGKKLQRKKSLLDYSKR